MKGLEKDEWVAFRLISHVSKFSSIMNFNGNFAARPFFAKVPFFSDFTHPNLYLKDNWLWLNGMLK